ncbi:MAG: haloacid dehalogenase [bacterium]|nr:haloacid dehalogenase [bacterium]
MATTPRPPFAAVYFDCDSTLATIEGVDELLDAVDQATRAEIAELTEHAMNGTQPLARIYEQRLQKIAPPRALLDRVGALYVANMVPDVPGVIGALRFLGKHVGIISGGLLTPVQYLANHLGIPLANVHAVPLLFDAAGNYRDFDRESPLWQNGGKITVLNGLPAAQRPVAFVGDGATDLETKGTAELFVGFGGVATRAAVRAGADEFVPGPGLAGVLGHVLTAAELDQLRSEPEFRELLSAGEL